MRRALGGGLALLVGAALVARYREAPFDLRRREATAPFLSVRQGSCFGNSTKWHALASARIESVRDGTGLGGGTPKFLITLEGGVRAIFKPHTSGLGRVYRDVAAFELVAYHLDCVWGLGRVPPAASRRVPGRLLRPAVTDQAQIRARIADAGDPRLPIGALLEERAGDDSVPGVMIYFVPGLRGGRTLDWAESQRAADALERLATTAAARADYADRDVFDYVINNWDRRNNNFYVGGGGLVYVDHNHLSWKRAAVAELLPHGGLAARVACVARGAGGDFGGRPHAQACPVDPCAARPELARAVFRVLEIGTAVACSMARHEPLGPVLLGGPCPVHGLSYLRFRDPWRRYFAHMDKRHRALQRALQPCHETKS